MVGTVVRSLGSWVEIALDGTTPHCDKVDRHPKSSSNPWPRKSKSKAIVTVRKTRSTNSDLDLVHPPPPSPPRMATLFCPSCSNILVISAETGFNKWACNTCPYEFPITKQMTSRTRLERKQADDVLGGEEMWKHADSIASELPIHPSFRLPWGARTLGWICMFRNRRSCSQPYHSFTNHLRVRASASAQSLVKSVNTAERISTSSKSGPPMSP